MSIRPPLSIAKMLIVRLSLFTSMIFAGAGCNFIHNYGSGSHLDAPVEKPQKHGTAKASTMQAQVTTDATGRVTTIEFVRSSGSNAVDGYVADSIRQNWPGGPSTRSLVEISYKPGTGFSDPKVLSSTPAP